MDESDHYYEKGKLVIRDDKIFDLGPAALIENKGKIINMKKKLVLPGFVNTHTHSPSSLFRGMADDLKLMDWLYTLIWPAEKHLTKEIVYWGAALSFLEFLRTGVTTFADQYFFSEAIGLAAEKSGLRGFIAPTVFSHPSPETDDPLQAAVDFIEKYKGKEETTRVYPCIGPHAPYSCNAYDLKQVAELAAKYKVMIHTHISETRDENEKMVAETGMTPTRYLEEMGILEQRVLAAHCIHLTAEDINILSEKKVNVSYNPVSNLKLVSGIMPLRELFQRDITVSLGTDGAQSNNSLDLLRDLKTGVLIQKNFNQDATFFNAGEALRMITIEGGRALGMADQIGSLEKGKKADLITLDMDEVNLNPIHRSCLDNIYSAVVYSASGHNVADVIVDGDILMKDRKFFKVSKEEILERARECSHFIMKKAGLI